MISRSTISLIHTHFYFTFFYISFSLSLFLSLSLSLSFSYSRNSYEPFYSSCNTFVRRSVRRAYFFPLREKAKDKRNRKGYAIICARSLLAAPLEIDTRWLFYPLMPPSLPRFGDQKLEVSPERQLSLISLSNCKSFSRHLEVQRARKDKRCKNFDLRIS